MYQELIKKWAEQQGFETFASDHAAVLRNLAKWLDMYGQGEKDKCRVCGYTYLHLETNTCEVCGTRR